MKVWNLRVSVVALAVILMAGLYFHQNPFVVKDTQNQDNKNFESINDNIIDKPTLNWKGGGGKDRESKNGISPKLNVGSKHENAMELSEKERLKKFKRDSKREKLNPRFSQRIEMLEKACSQMKETARIDQKPRKWSVNPQYKLVMCRTAKHGSTSWASFFVQLYSHGRSGGSQLASRKWEKKFVSDREKKDIVDSLRDPEHDYVSFFVCRNPVAKLVSIYNYHKVLSSSSYDGPTGPHKNIDGFPLDNPPSWDEYLTFDPYRTGLTRPMWMMCDPCHNYWDAVVLMETFDDDSATILKAIGSKVKVDHLNEHSNAAATGVQASLVWKLFSNTTRETLSKILEAYERDFLMCGYTDTLKELEKVMASKEEIQTTQN